jgi:glycosyltransferase involved in cell wall biosynthesis
MTKRCAVLLLIPHLGGGGAERVTELLARHLSYEKYDIHLGLVTGAGSAAGSLPAQVAVHALDKRRIRFAGLRLVRLIWRVRPEVVLCNMAHLNFLLLLLRPLLPAKTRILVRQNGMASAMAAGAGAPWLQRWLYRFCYARANRVICQSQAMLDDLREFACISDCAMAVLPNPIDLEAIRNDRGQQSEDSTGSAPHLVAVGRLSREKGFDLLLEALAEVRRDMVGADLTIAGTGPQDAKLQAQACALGIEGAVHFVGHVESMARLFSGASLFLVASRQEGLPNAVLEAAAAGLPIVAVPAVGGLAGLLSGKRGVWLAKEVSACALAEALRAALTALRPGERFAHSWVEDFSLEQAIPAYEELIDRTVREEFA